MAGRRGGEEIQIRRRFQVSGFHITAILSVATIAILLIGLLRHERRAHFARLKQLADDKLARQRAVWTGNGCRDEVSALKPPVITVPPRIKPMPRRVRENAEAQRPADDKQP